MRLLICMLLTIGGPAALAEPIEVGAPAPGFAIHGSDGNLHRLSDYSGQHVVIAFFPKAFTGG